MKPYCYSAGKITPLTKASVPLNSLSVLRGYGVFDFCRTYNGKLFHFADHYKRFRNSAKAIGLTVSLSQKEIESIIKKLFVKNKCRDASVRLMFLGGQTADGMNNGHPIFAILIEDLYSLPASVYQQGGKLITCDNLRHYAEAKSTSYITAIANAKRRVKSGAIEILYHHNGLVLEASTSNFWLVKGGRLITADTGVLPGITRSIVKKLARRRWPVELRPVKLKELWSADEAFITATNKKIAPVVAIDGRKIGKGKIGPVTKELMKLFDDYIGKY